MIKYAQVDCMINLVAITYVIQVNPCGIMQEEYRGFVKSLFVESLDYLVMSSLDGKICKLINIRIINW